MCGFVANAGRVWDSLQREAALQRLAHRGPDAKGQWQGEEGVWLGHCRLSIVDLSVDGNQPLSNEDNSLILVCNGEIYNAPSLRQELQEAGHRFRSNSDNEVILHAYECWGEGCLERLQGMFAFALWSVREKKLWLVRDPLGMKPLYYALLGDALVAASESCALLPFLAGVERPDPMALAAVLTLGYLPAPLSIWQGVVKLAAGHTLVWQGGKVVVKGYWQPAATLSVEKEYEFEKWQQLFQQVVKDHLLADVPISLFLSAGLDSSALAVALARQGQKLPSFTMDFVNSPRNEAPAAQVLADRLGFPHHGVTFATEEMYGLMAESGGLDEPLGTSSTMLYLAMCKRAAAHGKVVLGGDGGDEVLGGYTWYRNLYPLPTGSLMMRKALAKMIQRPVPAMVRSWAAWAFARSSVLHRHAWRIFPRFLPEEVSWLLSPMGVTLDDEAMLSPLSRYFEPRLPLTRALQRVDLMTYCCDYNNTRVDRVSMTHGLEVRLPFLDRRLVDYHLTRPWQPEEEKFSKPLLRQYLKEEVAPEILHRPKQGFSHRGHPPDWQKLLKFIADGVWVRNHYWHPQWQNLLLPGVPYREGRIWTLAMVTCWGNHWLGNSAGNQNLTML